jgi:hypothetical protein
MEKEAYCIFKFKGTDQSLFFSPEEFVNQGLKISRLTLLHLQCSGTNYYLFFGKNGYDNCVEFLFQFNVGNEFADFLINNGANYHKYDVVEILDSGAFPKFKLKDGQRIQLETYANGATEGLNIYGLSEANDKLLDIDGSPKALLGLPMADLKLNQAEVTLNLDWSSEKENGKVPATFTKALNEVTAKQKISDRKRFYYRSAFAVLIALVLYYIYFIR